MKNVFLIDFENVSDSGLEGFFDLSREDEVRLFYTSNAGKISIDFIRSMLSAEKCADIRFEKVSNGKQALDLQIATYLGSILENEANYFIISKDKEYAHIIDFWKVRKPDRNIALKKSIAEGFAQSPTVAEMPESPVLS